jgi:hypothetical protein
VALEEKNAQIDALSKDTELQRKKKCDIWGNLSSAKTRLSSCIAK